EPVAWVLFGIAAMPSVAFWGRIARRIGTPRAFAAAALAEALGVIASVAWRGPAGVVLAGALVGGTFMGLTALGLMRALELAPDRPARMVARMTSAFGIGQCAGPLLAGAIADWTGGFGAASLIAAAALALAAFLATRGGVGGTQR
ncbi:MAG: YbfB/YjiJ family MFS transporter, partial [Rhodospirillales bacterium]|nr:YbfB/YjiJ family MFS transporter [Rhodospirillales bacterium]